MIKGTIKGGFSFKEKKVETPIEDLPLSKELIITLKQHKGPACKAEVKKDSEIKIGDLIGVSKDELSAPIYATVSGKVIEAPKRFPDIRGGYVAALIIESNGKQDWSISPLSQDLLQQSEEVLLEAIKKLGLVDFGIDAIPLSTKIMFAKTKRAKRLIINGIDLEPGSSVYYRLIVEKKEELINGIKLLKKLLDLNTIYLAIEETNRQAKEQLVNLLSGIAELAVLKSKFPQGIDKFVIKAITGREVPSPNGVPEDVGTCVIRADSVIALWESLKEMKPQINQIVTVYGAVNMPKNLRVRIGTPLKDILVYCGVNDEIGKVIVGGPMMGLAQYSLRVPITREITSIYVQRESDVAIISKQKCINCGFCVKVCPMGLLPNIIASYCETDKFEEAVSYNIYYCEECGCCSYICPVKIPLVHLIKYGKSQLKREEL
jgi:electron transport complex protein RnfC